MVPKDFPDNGDTSLDILNAGRKRNIKIANVSTLNYVKTPYKKIKIQIFNNLVIILEDSLIDVIFNINNDDPPITRRFPQIFMAFFFMMAKTNHRS